MRMPATSAVRLSLGVAEQQGQQMPKGEDANVDKGEPPPMQQMTSGDEDDREEGASPALVFRIAQEQEVETPKFRMIEYDENLQTFRKVHVLSD